MSKSKKEKPIKNKRIQIEFDSKHLPVVISALETYSRLQSGQIGMAMEEVYLDRWLTHDEREHIENTIRYYAFPSEANRRSDGHGGFEDQYGNTYNEEGEIINEGEIWKRFKKRPHLDHKNSSFGVGCEEMKRGTIAWEIKKAIQEFLHYERNDGYRDMGVDGDGVLNISGIPSPKVIDPNTNNYWKPIKKIKIPNRHQEKIKQLVANKQYKEAWALIEISFKNTPLPKGSSYTIENENEIFYIAVEKPFKSPELLFK
jgi:hypothetical protein